MALANGRPPRIALPLIASYWIAATFVSGVAVLIFDPFDGASKLIFSPLLPLLPVLMFVAFGFSPPVNPFPIGIVFSALIFPSVFIGLCSIVKRFSIPAVAVGVCAGLANGVLTAACFRAMIRSL
ncbi:hypothetical protein FF011L_20040 [Roseimaritima multifibrata]|uniref:Uncharacterized protein n=1 Tax=Roseimaritima multifibrata TaxID=1930274 RepID=A0A517MED2_9BACT|nr:hypothetical protein FF011L_20040 [Roseimaritima multifibrata]